MCAYGERRPSPRSIREWHLHAPYMLFRLVTIDMVWSNQMACFHTLSRLKVATRDGSSRDYPGMFRLVQAVNGYDLRFEIKNSTQNELGKERVISLMLHGDGLCAPYAHIPLGAHG